MKALRYIVPALSLALLGAHFLREGAWVITALCLALAVMLAWPRPWTTRILQGALVFGTAEWIWTACVLVQERMATGRPWGRMALILAVVALMTAASIVAVQMGKRSRT